MAEPVIDDSKKYLIKGPTLKKLWKRWVRGVDGYILAKRDAEGNTTLRLSGNFGRPVECYIIRNGEAVRAFIPIKFPDDAQ